MRTQHMKYSSHTVHEAIKQSAAREVQLPQLQNNFKPKCHMSKQVKIYLKKRTKMSLAMEFWARFMIDRNPGFIHRDTN